MKPNPAHNTSSAVDAARTPLAAAGDGQVSSPAQIPDASEQLAIALEYKGGDSIGTIARRHDLSIHRVTTILRRLQVAIRPPSQGRNGRV